MKLPRFSLRAAADADRSHKAIVEIRLLGPLPLPSSFHTGSLRAPFSLEVILLVHRCDYCGKVETMNHHWKILESGAEFCSWRCLRLFAQMRENQEKELDEEKSCTNSGSALRELL